MAELDLTAAEPRVVSHIQQPEGSSLCGHCCVAMALGIELDEAIKRIGHRRGVRNYEVVKALGRACRSTASEPLRRGMETTVRPPAPSVIRVKELAGRGRRHHVVLFALDGKVYDPAWPKPAPTFLEWHEHLRAMGWRMVSFFRLTRAGRSICESPEKEPQCPST